MYIQYILKKKKKRKPKALSNNRLLQTLFFRMTGNCIYASTSLLLFAYTLQFRLVRPDFPADAVA